MREERREKGKREGEKERRQKEKRAVDYAAACSHALCCPVLWTKNLLFEAYDLPQWFHVFASRSCFKHFCLFQAILDV